MKELFQQLARYNRWANGRLFQAAFDIPDQEYRRDIGAFFKSLHGTLNHLLVTDRIWLKRLTGQGEHPDKLHAIIHDDKRMLALDRAEQDERIIKTIDDIGREAFGANIKYANLSGHTFEQRRSDVLMHVFNHQTHHRGQAHCILSICTGVEPPSLDLLAMQRSIASPDMRTLQ
jgi:uncharacterized damage-inducible protein DinB